MKLKESILLKYLIVYTIIFAFSRAKGQNLPELLFPINHSIVVDTAFQIQWNCSGSVDIYISQTSSFSTIDQELVNNSDGYFDITNLHYNTNYFLKIINNTTSDSIIKSFYIKSLNDYNISAWFIADEVEDTIGGFLNSWTDKSQNNYTVSQSNTLMQPDILYDNTKLNNHKSIQFDGNDFLQGGDFLDIMNNSRTMLIIGKALDDPGYFISKGAYIAENSYGIGLFGGGDIVSIFIDDATHVARAGYTKGSFDIITAVIDRNSEQNTLSVNSQVVDISSNIQDENYMHDNTDNFVIGKIGSYELIGEIAEILLFDSALNTNQLDTVYNYLRNVYSPPINLPDSVIIEYGFNDTTISAFKDWYVDYEWSNGIMDSATTINSTGWYSVTVTDEYNFTSVDSVFVKYPEINQLLDTSLCFGDSIVWNTGLTHDYSFVWNDISTDSLIVIKTSGSYHYTITDSYGNSLFSDTADISISNFPVELDLGEDASICSGTAYFPNTVPDNILSYNWNDGSNNEYIIIDTPGQYSLILESDIGCFAYDTIDFLISGLAPAVAFSIENTCMGDSSRMTDLSSTTDASDIVDWLWIFDNTDSLYIQNPSYVFDSIGVHTVELSVITDNNCQNTINQFLSIKSKPIASFYSEFGNSTCTDTDVAFINTSFDTTTFMSNYWITSEGETSSDFNPNFSFSNIGQVYIKLIVTNANSCQDSVLNYLSINNSLPTPVFPSLISPSNNFTTINDTILFEWNAIENAAFYQVLISKDENFSIAYIDSNCVTNTLSLSIEDTSFYYWKIIPYNACHIEGSESQIYSFQKLSFSVANNCAFWMIADSASISNDTIIELYDEITNLAIPKLEGNPKLKDDKLNGRVINFDGASSFSFGDRLDLLKSSHSFFILSKAFSGGGYFFSKGLHVENSYALGIYTDDRLAFPYKDIESNNIATIDYSLSTYDIILAKSNRILKLNTLSFGQNTLTSSSILDSSHYFDSNENFLIGKAPSFFLEGTIAEIIVFDTILGQEEEQNVNKYLRDKYAPPVNLGHDIRISYGFCDTSIHAYQPWFTSYLWSTGSTDSVITVQQTGQYSVTVTDVFGFTSSDNIIVNYPGKISFIDSTICYGDTIRWNTGLNHHYDFLWSDNSTDSILNIDLAGDYYVTITDSLGCIYKSDTNTIIVDHYPQLVSLGDDDTLCAGINFHLLTGENETASYSWSTGETDAYIVVANSGNYSVTSTNDYGCTAVDSINIFINNVAPTPGFYAENQCLGEITNFIDTSQSMDLSNIIEWHWDFGDGNTSTLQHPEFTFPEVGLYNVNLRIVTDSLCENSFNQEINIYSKPEVHFSNNWLCQNYLVDFINTSTSDMGDIDYTRWDFGNNDTSLDFSVQRIFANEGTYPVQLRVKTINECFNTLDTNIVIEPSPKAQFSNTPACVGKEVTFIDESEHTDIFEVTAWQWESSKGDFSNEASPIFTFDLSEMVEVTLMATAVNGCSDSITKNVWVYQNPTASFIVDTLCAYNPLVIENTSGDAQSTIQQYYWWLNGELISTEIVPEYTLQNSGDYLLELKVVSQSNCYQKEGETITVHPLPKASFSVSENYTTPDQNIVFTADSIDDNFKYLYLFDDENEANIPIISKSYTQEAWYYPSLMVNNQWLCYDSSETEIRIVQPLMDLAISDLNMIEKEDKYLLKIRLANLGNLSMKGIVFRIEVEDAMVFEELYDTLLIIGDSYLLELNTQLLNQAEYICVSALPNSIFSDIDLENNTVCLTLSKQEDLLKLYPNPVADELNLLFNSNENKTLEFNIINDLGQTVRTIELDIKKGLFKYSLTTKKLNQGHYILKFEDFTKKFIKE